jgi:protein TonB
MENDSSSSWMKNSIDDIVFYGRNQSYGAYFLRRVYSKHMTRGILAAILMFLLLLETPAIIRFLEGVLPEDPQLLEMKEVVLTEAPPLDPKRSLPPPPKVAFHPKVDKLQILNPEVKKDIEVKEKEPEIDQKTVKAEIVDSNQNKTQTSNIPSNTEGNGTEANSAATTSSGGSSGDIYNIVEDAPRFPGCEQFPSLADRQLCANQRLQAYLYRNIKYPDLARKTGIQGRCIISFVVEKDGKITNAKIQHDIGGGCGEEALRVVSSMNNMSEPWKPGRQRGNPVRVQFNLPINFNLR